MKEALLGLNHLVSPSATCHTVRPRSPALSSGQRRMAPPKSSSGMPRCFSYHAARSVLLPLLLKKTPPIPVTLAIVVSQSLSRLTHLRQQRVQTGVQQQLRLSSCRATVFRTASCKVRPLPFPNARAALRAAASAERTPGPPQHGEVGAPLPVLQGER